MLCLWSYDHQMHTGSTNIYIQHLNSVIALIVLYNSYDFKCYVYVKIVCMDCASDGHMTRPVQLKFMLIRDILKFKTFIVPNAL